MASLNLKNDASWWLVFVTQASEISKILSSLDAQQVEEQLKVAERRFGDVDRRMHRKLHLLQTTHQGAESATVDIGLIRQWVAEKTELVRQKEPLGFKAKNAETKLQQTKVINYRNVG